MPAGRLAVDLDQLKRVPVHVQRMIVFAAIAKHQAVAPALLQHKFLVVRIFLAVDGPTVEQARAAGNFFKNHVDGLVRRGLRPAAVQKSCSPKRILAGATHCGCLCWFAYSTTTPMPPLRASSVVAPRIQTPGWFISTMASTRSPGPM